jgi:hypothetical protein
MASSTVHTLWTACGERRLIRLDLGDPGRDTSNACLDAGNGRGVVCRDRSGLACLHGAEIRLSGLQAQCLCLFVFCGTNTFERRFGNGRNRRLGARDTGPESDSRNEGEGKKKFSHWFSFVEFEIALMGFDRI